MRLCKLSSPVVILLTLCVAAPLFAQDKELKAVASTLAESLAKSPKKALAVVDFTDLQGNVTELGRFLAEELSVALANTDKGLEVLDRTHLKALLQEHKLAATGVIDPLTARKLGEIAGVQILITGTITPFGDSVRSTVKALDTSTAKVISASTIEIPRTKAIEELLSRSVLPGASTSGGSGGPPNPAQRTGATYAGETKRIGQLEVKLKGCHSQPEGIRCEALVKNLGEERQFCLYSIDGDVMSRIVDEGGNVYVPSRIRLAEKDVYGRVITCSNLPSAVPVNAGLLFGQPTGGGLFGARRQEMRTSDLPSEGARLAMVEFRFDIKRSYAGRTSMVAQFRDVPVTK